MKYKVDIFPLLALLCILAVAADLRLFRVESVPGWYNDEGSCINLAANLLQGRIEYFGVQGSMLFAARMPLFIWLLAFAFQFFGVDITVLRFLTAGIGIINTALIYFILQKWSRPAALICALVFAFFPRAVLYSRIGFSYNLLAMLVLLLFWASSQYLDTGRRRYAAAGALTLGLSLLSELAAVAYIPVFLIVILWKRWKDIWFALPLAVLPPLLYSAAMLWIYPDAYGPDLQYALFRVSSVALPVQFVMILLNSAMIHQDLFLLIGAAGVFFSPMSELTKRLVLFLFLPLIIITRSVTVDPLGWHYLIPLFPFYAIGVGVLVHRFVSQVISLGSQVFNQAVTRLPIRIHPNILRFLQPGHNLLFIVLLLIAPILYLIYTAHVSIRENTLVTEVDPILLDSFEARAVADFINKNTGRDDIVLASPSLAWALEGNVSDYQITLAYMGLSTRFFPNDASQARFRFNPSYQNAKFIVIDPVWLNWGEPNLKDLATFRHFAEQFSVAFKTDHILVYQIQGR